MFVMPRYDPVGDSIRQGVATINEKIQQDKNAQSLLKAQSIVDAAKANSFKPVVDDTQIAAAAKAKGFSMGDNPYEQIGKLSKAWGESDAQIGKLRGEIENADAATQQILNSQIGAEQSKQKAYSDAATGYRSLLDANKMSTAGFSSGDNASGNWDTISQYTAKSGGLIPSGIPIDLAPEGDNSQYNTLSQLNPDSIKNPALTANMLRNNSDILNMAQRYAMKANVDNFNYNDSVSNITRDLIKAGIDPKTIASMQAGINEKAKSIGMQYAMAQAKGGDYTDVAKYAVTHGMTDLLPTIGAMANKNTIDLKDFGGTINPVLTSVSPYGGPVSASVGQGEKKTLSPDAQQRGQEFSQTLAFNKEKFTKEYELQKQQFGDTKALQWAQLQLQNDKLSLDQREHIAGKIRAGTEIIKTENDSLSKQITEIYKNAPPSGLTSAQQYEVESIKSKIAENNEGLKKYSGALDDSLGIKTTTPANTKSGKITDAQFDKGYNYLVLEKGFTPDQALAEMKRLYW